MQAPAQELQDTPSTVGKSAQACCVGDTSKGLPQAAAEELWRPRTATRLLKQAFCRRGIATCRGVSQMMSKPSGTKLASGFCAGTNAIFRFSTGAAVYKKSTLPFCIC